MKIFVSVSFMFGLLVHVAPLQAQNDPDSVASDRAAAADQVKLSLDFDPAVELNFGAFQDDATSSTAAPAPAKPTGILPIPKYGGDLSTRSYLTGDWGGTRADLADKGIEFDIEFQQYSQSVVDGGLDSETAWGGKGSYSLHLDLAQMDVMPGALVYARVESRWGRSSLFRTGQLLPTNLTSLVPVDYDDLERETWGAMTNLSYTQFLSEEFGVFIGKLDLFEGADPNEFAGGRGDTQFMNYNLIFAAPTAIIPASTLGVGIIVLPNKNVTISSAALSATDSSFSNGFDDLDTGAIWASSIMTQYRLGDLPGGFNATFVKWFNKDFTDLKSIIHVPGEGIISSTKDGSWLVALSAWQYLYTEEASEGPLNPANKMPDLQGWGLFARLGLADKDTNPLHTNFSVGIGGRGVLPNRDNDVFGVGYFYTEAEPDRFETTVLGIQDYAQGMEAFYNLAITPAAKFTLDLQWLDSVEKSIDDAIVLGGRLQLSF